MNAKVVIKSRSLLFILLPFFFLLAGCWGSGPVTHNATGMIYEIVVVMDKDAWTSPAGEAIKSQLASPIPGLPQSEASFKVSFCAPKHFNDFLTYVRNILIVKIDSNLFTKVSLKAEHDRYAKNQVIMVLNAPSADAIVEHIKAHPTSILDYFNQVEIDRTINLLDSQYSSLVMKHVRKAFDIQIKVPSDMGSYRDTTNFFWASNDAKIGRTDFIAYTFPYKDKNTFTAEYLIAKRDSVLKRNIPGAFPNSYMKTNAIETTYEAITLKNGKYCGVLRGLWEMQGDMMGGPFISHIRLDEKNKRVVVVEGFVFAPETDKRNYIRRIEASLYTLQLPGEFVEPSQK
jgi:hypothetical protein